MDSILKTWTVPATGLASNVAAYVAEERAVTAPNPAAQGTAVPFAATSLATHAPIGSVMVAGLGARSTDLPGPGPRGAPV